MSNDRKLLPLLSSHLLDTCSWSSHRPGSKLFIQGALSLGAFLEATYRARQGNDADLSLDEYADLIVAMFGDSGAHIALGSVGNDQVSFINRVCPFHTRSCHDTAACNISSAILGGIAARHFGYARVMLDNRVRAGEVECKYLVYTSERNDPGRSGDVYRLADGKVELYRETNVSRMETPEPARQEHRAMDNDGVVIVSSQMQEVMRTVGTIAPTSATVLISGETGVGKECVAAALHRMSNRSNKPFLPVNCGAIPEGLVESALFGHERGAFSGAHQLHRGFFERAKDGTLFLDEFDTLSDSAQTRLLRVLQEGTYERVGGRKPLHSNARIVAATNANLDQAVEAKRFRADLYYRINVVNIRVPPLRERTEDIPMMAEVFLRRLCDKHGCEQVGISEQAMTKLLANPWYGNVRELENVLERSLLLNGHGKIEHVLLNDSQPVAEVVLNSPLPNGNAWKGKKTEMVGELERSMLDDILSKTHGNVSKAAEELGLSRRAVYFKLNRHQIDPKDYRS